MIILVGPPKTGHSEPAAGTRAGAAAGPGPDGAGRGRTAAGAQSKVNSRAGNGPAGA